jgi:hypothetical protein
VENSNPLGGTVDLGLLQGLQVLVDREGDLGKLSLVVMVERVWKPQPLLEVEEDYL